MANNGILLGRVSRSLSKWQGIKGLFDRRLSSRLAVRRCFTAFKRKHEYPLLRLNNAVHTAVFAPTGTGKGASIVVPFLKTCTDSCVVLDFKGDLCKLTAGDRHRMGHEIVILDPFDVVGGTDTLNVLAEIDPADPLAIDQCNALAKALVVRGNNEAEPHWNERAEAVISTTCAAMLLSEGGSLQSVRKVLTDSVKFKAMLKACAEDDSWGGMLARAGGELMGMMDKELSGVMSTVGRHTRFLDTLAVAASTTSSTFDPSRLLTGKMTIYLVLPPEHMRSQAALLRMWINCLLHAVVKGGLQERNKVHFVLDEAASLGKLDALEDAVDKFRGYGVRLLFLYQSLGQLKKCWGDGGDQTLLSNTTQVFFAVNDQMTAEYVSNRLGEATITVSSGGAGTSRQDSQNSQRGGHSYSHSTSDNWSQIGRKLLKPEEVMALDPRMAITFTPGVPPIASWLVRWFEDDLKPIRGVGFFRALIDAACMLACFGFLAVVVTVWVNEKSQRRDGYGQGEVYGVPQGRTFGNPGPHGQGDGAVLQRGRRGTEATSRSRRD